MTPPTQPASTPATAPERADWHTLSADEVLQRSDVEATQGLSTAEAEARVQRFGPNRFTAAETESRVHAFLRQYADPMQLVLFVAGIGSLYPLKEVGTGILLLLLTVFNAVLGLRQEGKAAAAVAALQKMMIVTARVRRDGALAELPAEQLVPGDIVAIEAGDIVPADGRLLRAATLEVAESALTGESLPVSKGTAPVSGEDTPLGDRSDMVYMNTNVTRGSGEFVVVATGMATQVGNISGMLQGEEETKTPLTRQLDTLTRQIFLIAGLALLVSVVINLARGETFTAIFHAAVAFAIGALPENMPAVVTTILAYGTQALAKVGAIMKRLQSTETLGSTSAINSDKTGTLTLNEMTAVEMVVVGRRYAVEGTGYSSQGQITHVAGQGVIPLDPFLLPMVLASDAVMDQGALIGDPTEGAAGRPGRQGWRRRGVDPPGLPPRGRAAVRRRVQADGDLPPDDRRVRRRGRAVLRRREPPTSCCPGREPFMTPTPALYRPTARSGNSSSPRTPASVPTVCGCWRPHERTSTRRTSTLAVTCWWRCRTAWNCCPWSGSSTRRGPRPRPRSPPRRRPASESG